MSDAPQTPNGISSALFRSTACGDKTVWRVAWWVSGVWGACVRVRGVSEHVCLFAVCLGSWELGGVGGGGTYASTQAPRHSRQIQEPHTQSARPTDLAINVIYCDLALDPNGDVLYLSLIYLQGHACTCEGDTLGEMRANATRADETKTKSRPLVPEGVRLFSAAPRGAVGRSGRHARGRTVRRDSRCARDHAAAAAVSAAAVNGTAQELLHHAGMGDVACVRRGRHRCGGGTAAVVRFRKVQGRGQHQARRHRRGVQAASRAHGGSVRTGARGRDRGG
eukprot:scaffold38071_cov107-Isochrysis_galbana.AAC.9